MKDILEKKYDVAEEILSPHKFGIPQHRAVLRVPLCMF
jgi:hypothetical protein